jgi:transcriptional regulator with XRE-family HTH domain
MSSIAASSGIDHDTIAAYENGELRPTPEDLARIMKAADTRPSILTDDLDGVVHFRHILDEAVPL